MLEKRGYSVVLPATAMKRSPALDREPLDVILMDVQMPGMDGLKPRHRFGRQKRAAAGMSTSSR